jgi:hypothetical protein
MSDMRNTRWYPKRDQSQRDSNVTKKQFDDNWEKAFGKKDKKVEEAEEKVESTGEQKED